ncbi:GEVED domain-containing protein [Tenacibaculum amylolyticum]|uniref:GEVED domain-containing protein n=1 Tax=Tenacibaculum amylolyticum TaxID=104269 RepID=UPI003894F532
MLQILKPLTKNSFYKSLFVLLLFSTITTYAQCPGTGHCGIGTFDNRYEQVDASNIAGAVFCSGETRNVTLNVIPGTTLEAFDGDVEHVTLFFDFNCDGVYESLVTNSCTYSRAAGGCNINLSVTVPAVTATTTYNGRVHLDFNGATTDPCANVGFGEIENFTITVEPAPAITTQPTNQTVFVNDNAVFSVVATNTTAFQWEVSTDGGTTFNPISDGAEYTGTITATLTVLNANTDKGNYRYRVLLNNAIATCPTITSAEAILDVRYRTVITNRRITYKTN